MRHKGRGGEGGGDGHRQAFGQHPREAVEARPQRWAQHDDPGHRRERELPAGVGHRARIQGEGHDGGEEQRVHPRSRPRRRHRDQRRRAHDSGPLQRRPGTGERDVDGYQARAARRSAPPGAPHRAPASTGNASAHSRATFWPLTARMCASPTGSEAVADVLVDGLVLAQDHAAEQGGLRRREPAVDRALCAGTHAVDGAGRLRPAHVPSRAGRRAAARPRARESAGSRRRRSRPCHAAGD